MKLARIGCILLAMATISTRATEDVIDKLAQDPRCARALDWIDKNSDWVTEQQIRLNQIPAAEFNEAQRGAYFKKLFEQAGFKVHVDKTGNVIAERTGGNPKSVVLVVAHLDTVFPTGTDVSVKRNGTRLEGPGISDNAAGLAAVIGAARAIAESRVATNKTLVFSGDVGEEGEGNLRGIRALVDSYGPRLAAVIAVDGASSDHITTQGIASRRFEIRITGPGGHSWSDFGGPNAISALARGIVKFSAYRVPEEPRSSFNFGVIEGGTSVNSIPSSASVKIDLRSEEESELAKLEAGLREAMQAGLRDEITGTHSLSDALQLNLRSLGARPAGKLPENSPLLDTVRSVDQYLGIRSRIERSSTDANIPLSQGIPAIALGGGGKGGGSHTLTEWYDPTGRELGLKRLVLITLALAGIHP